jgi:hypothetical protein
VYYRRALAHAHDRRVADRPVRPFSYLDRRHGDFLRRQEVWKPFLSPLCLLSNQ